MKTKKVKFDRPSNWIYIKSFPTIFFVLIKHLFNLICYYYVNFVYGRKPVPISTINFLKGTEQPLHSDYIHFGSTPELYLAGAWYALEDVDENNGPLTICPKSNKLSTIDFTDLNLKIPKSTN